MKIDSNRLNATGHSVKLDPKLFKSDPAVMYLARVVSEHIELYRLELVASEPPREGLLGVAFYPSEETPWYELFTNGGVLEAIVRDIGWELDTLCKAIVKKLKPPNWQLFFWMGHASKAIREWDMADRDKGAMEKLFIERDKNQKRISSEAGKKSGEERRKKGTREWVQELYEKHLHEGRPKHERADKIAKTISRTYPVTAQYVRRLILGFKKIPGEK